MDKNNEDKPKGKSALIDIKTIWDKTEGGRVIIEDLYPQSREAFVNRKNFKIRDDDKYASCSVFQDKNKEFWFMQDRGAAIPRQKMPSCSSSVSLRNIFSSKANIQVYSFI